MLYAHTTAEERDMHMMKSRVALFILLKVKLTILHELARCGALASMFSHGAGCIAASRGASVIRQGASRRCVASSRKKLNPGTARPLHLHAESSLLDLPRRAHRARHHRLLRDHRVHAAAQS